MCWLPPQGNCTHPEDMKLCTVIMKSNGSFPVNRRRLVSAQGRDPSQVFPPLGKPTATILRPQQLAKGTSTSRDPPLYLTMHTSHAGMEQDSLIPQGTERYP